MSNSVRLLLDASKAFDKVCYNELFTMLIKRNVSPLVIRFLIFMYTNQSMRVKWKDSLPDNVSFGNGIRQTAVLSTLLFALYIDIQKQKQNNNVVLVIRHRSD